MDSKDIFEGIKKRILLMKDVDKELITRDSSFLSLNFDSLDYVEIQVFTLDCYGVRVDDKLFAKHKIISIEQLVNHVKSNIKL
nr:MULTISPECIES: hypothetical protein [Serratia]ULG12131.1 hypothetical protein D1p2_00017 [Serratia entomophila]ULG12328.1 hypothetical protein M3p_00030 [Serratia entomophila]ULG12350.1 hypothetical protein M3p_00054 [Serratia entomophila]ULG15958.1 hypothetical protein 591p_00107 [Serratia proteamaculans]ULG18444.1 hypothetical protein Man4p_00127 [Serratia proteamaculans]